MKILLLTLISALNMVVAVYQADAADAPRLWKMEFPIADFSIANVEFDEIRSGGPPRDGIPPIDHPKFAPASTVELAATEPVIGMEMNGEWKAYPLQVLMWHEIANDEIGGVPVAVTFCPLCNAAIVFDRRLDGEVYDFGTTGKLRRSDLVMYDRQTESFWQQAIGEGIIGVMTGKKLKVMTARLESWQNYKARAGEDALVLVPNAANMRPYGKNPYVNYDASSFPMLYDGDVPDNVEPLERVVTTPDRLFAYSLTYLREAGSVTASDGTVISWEAGQNSALDTRTISNGKDVGNVIATRNGADVPYFVEFAFVFHTFTPNVQIMN